MFERLNVSLNLSYALGLDLYGVRDLNFNADAAVLARQRRRAPGVRVSPP
jgi:hypothetical protein